MRVEELHSWDVTPEEAWQIQIDLAERVSRNASVAVTAIGTVAGVDNAYVRLGKATIAIAAVVVLTFPGLEPVETRVATREIRFPYVPGLLSFREAPAVIAACREVVAEPEIVLFDGQGIAHPRRLGLASHLGLLLDRPTVGCAKSRLVGQWEEPGAVPGDWSPLHDRGEIVGAAVRTRSRHKPLFVSPGHRMDVATAIAVTLACCRDGRFMPEPTRLAHETVSAAARELRRDGSALAEGTADGAAPGPPQL